MSDDRQIPKEVLEAEAQFQKEQAARIEADLDLKRDALLTEPGWGNLADFLERLADGEEPGSPRQEQMLQHMQDARVLSGERDGTISEAGRESLKQEVGRVGLTIQDQLQEQGLNTDAHAGEIATKMEAYANWAETL